MMLIYMNILDHDDDIDDDDDDDDGISMLYMLHSFIFIDDTVSIRVCWISKGHDSHCVESVLAGPYLDDVGSVMGYSHLMRLVPHALCQFIHMHTFIT